MKDLNVWKRKEKETIKVTWGKWKKKLRREAHKIKDWPIQLTSESESTKQKKKKCKQSQTKINGKKICHSFYKGLISLTYEELLEMYKKMTNHPVGK